MVVNGEDVAVESAAEVIPEKTAVDDASDDDSEDDMPELGTCVLRPRTSSGNRKQARALAGWEDYAAFF